MMKKIMLLPVMAALLLTGCGKEQNVNLAESGVNGNSVLNPIVFTSTASDDNTKVEIDGYNLKFSVGENIAVASFNYASETEAIKTDYATFGGTVASASGTFTPANYTYGADWAGAASAVSFYSYYPSSAVAPTITGTTATVTNIGTTQNGTLSNIVCWAKGSQVATADEVTAGNAPSFHYSPVCSLLKLTIVNNDDTNATSLSSITLTATSGNNIAGDASLNLLTGSLTGGSSESVEYIPAASPQLEIAKGGSVTLYLSFIPTTIGSFQVSFNDTKHPDNCYSVTIDSHWPEALLPGRMYARTLTITDISPVSVTGSLGTYNGVKFARGFLKRTSTSATSVSDMRFSDATVNPLEILGYANVASSTDSYYMYFSRNHLATIFGGESGESFDTNTITVEEKSYKVPSKTSLEALVSTTRSSDSPTINGSEKAWSCVRINLSDSYTTFGTDYSNKGFTYAGAAEANYIQGVIFFPDGATVVCGSINVSKCNTLADATFNDPNAISCAQLNALVDEGCLFVPFAGGHTNTPAWAGRGTYAYGWSSTYSYDDAAKNWLLVIKKGDTPATSTYTESYSPKRHFPVMLVVAD